MSQLVECPQCHGDGEVFWYPRLNDPVTCDECNGQKVVTQSSLSNEQRRKLVTDDNGQLYVRG